MIKYLVRCLTLSFCICSMVACTQNSGSSSATPKLETDEQKTLYAL